MLKPSITPQNVCDLLNELLELDHACIEALFLRREFCNSSIANHSTVMVQETQSESGSEASSQLGVVGIINGMFGVREDGMGAICFETEPDSTGTERIVKFKFTPPAESRVW